MMRGPHTQWLLLAKIMRSTKSTHPDPLNPFTKTGVVVSASTLGHTSILIRSFGWWHKTRHGASTVWHHTKDQAIFKLESMDHIPITFDAFFINRPNVNWGIISCNDEVCGDSRETALTPYWSDAELFILSEGYLVTWVLVSPGCNRPDANCMRRTALMQPIS